MQTEEKDNETIRSKNERRNCLQKRFHLCKHVADHANVVLRVTPSVLLAASSQIASQLSQVYSQTNVLFEYHVNI